MDRIVYTGLFAAAAVFGYAIGFGAIKLDSKYGKDVSHSHPSCIETATGKK